MVYDDDTTVADEAVWALREAFEDAGITVKEALRIHDDHWYAVLPGAPLAAYQGVRFERSDHRFTAQGVFDGRVTHASREALRDTLAPDPAAVAVTRSLLGAADEVPLGGLRDLVQGHLAAATTFTDAELAAVAVTVTSGPRRDEVWAWLDRARGARAVALWSDAVRRLPDSHVAAPAAVLAFAAWLAGDGALAWCAVDRSRDAEPHHSLATLVAGLLESATSPGDVGDPAAAAGRGHRSRRLRHRSGWVPTPARSTRVRSWEKRSSSRSSAGLTARATARRCVATSTCSRGCCARRGSTPTTR